MSKWVQLTKAQAKTHKLYGVGGWLILFYIFFVLNMIAGIGQGNQAAHKFFSANDIVGGNPFAFITLDTKTFGLQLLGWIQCLIYFVVMYFALTANHNFRKYANVLLLGFVFLKPVLLVLTMNFMELIEFPFYLFFIGAVLLYLNLSKRVRVTYDWTVKRTDAFLSGINNSDELMGARTDRKEPTL